MVEKQKTFRMVQVNDKMQHDYQYMLTEPGGKNFHPDFKPQLTASDMLLAGFVWWKIYDGLPD